jgi:DNA-binding NtrC family response regulator
MLATGGVLTDRDVVGALPVTEAGRSDLPNRAFHDGRPVECAATVKVAPEVEFARIQSALSETGGNKSAAARKLGVSRRLLYRRLERYQAPLDELAIRCV